MPADFDARTRVHEYGGGAVWTDGGAIFCSSFADGRVYRVEDGDAEAGHARAAAAERAALRGRLRRRTRRGDLRPRVARRRRAS